MRRHLFIALIFTTLFSSLAFAWDSHPEAIVGHDSTAVELLEESHDHGDEDHHGDHCCHGISHLLAISFGFTTSPTADRARPTASLSRSPIELYIPPLLRPPIS